MKNIRFILMGFCYLLFATILIGQSPTYVAHIEHFSEKIPELHQPITSVCKDSRGLLWIGTWGGLFSYDGYELTKYDGNENSPIELSNSFVYDVKENQVGQILVGTDDGLNILDLATKSNTLFLKEHEKQEGFGISGKNAIHQIIVDEEQVWLNHGGKICRLLSEKSQWIQPDSIKNIKFIVKDDAGLFWAFNPDFKFFVLNKSGDIVQIYEHIDAARIGFLEQKKRLKTSTEREANDLSESLYSHIDKLNNRWKHKGEIVLPLHPLQLEIQPEIEKINYPFNNHFWRHDKIFQSNDFTWMVVDKKLYQVNLKPKVFQTPATLHNISTRAMYEMPSGEIYIGAYDNGIAYNTDSQKVRYLNDIGLVTEFIEWGKDTLFLITDGRGFMLFDIQQEKIIKKWKTPKRSFFYAEKEEDQTIWFANMGNLFFIKKDFIYTPFKLENGHEPFKGSKITTLKIDSQNNIWVGSTEGLFRCSKGNVIKSKPATIKLHLKKGDICHLHEDKHQKFWLCTTRGLLYFNPKTDVVEQTFTKEDGLPHNLLYGLLPQGDSVLWIATFNGLSRFHIPTKSFTNYFEKDGLSGNEFNRKSFFKASDGKMYFGGTKGVTIFDPTTIQLPTESFHAFISKIHQHSDIEKKVIEHPFFEPNSSKIILQPYDKFIEFYFGCSDYTNPKQNTFAYQLAGFNEEWSYSTKNNIRYTNLDEGDYIFRMKAKNPNGLWSKNIVEVPFIVETAFHKTW